VDFLKAPAYRMEIDMKSYAVLFIFIMTTAILSLPGLSAQDIPESVSDDEQDKIEVTWKILWKKKTGSLPKGVELTVDGSEAWVTNFGHDRGHNISIFNADSGEFIRHISFSGRAVEIAFSPDGNTAYVSNFDTGKLIAIDTSTYKILDQVKSGTNPKIVTLSPSGDRIYVSNWSSNDVSVIDSSSLKVIGKARVGTNPRGSATDKNGENLFVANFNGHTMSVVDTEKIERIKTLKMKRHPRHVTMTPDGKWILCSNMGRGANAIAMIDPVEMEVKKWVKVGTGPKVIQVSPDSKVFFTADYFSHTVTIVDLAKGEVIGTIPKLGKAPCGMHLSDDGKTLYLTSWYSNEVRAISLEYNIPED
jgi:YVTN family beta-propeller protein